MLSKKELQYLENPDAFNPDYARILRHRIKCKVQRLKSEIPLLNARGFSVTENCNGVTEFHNGEKRQNQGSFPKIRQEWWGRRDLNPGSPAPQAGILDQTRRRPHLCLLINQILT